MTRTLRNIPAYAGKTQPSGRAHRSHQEHPRVCGENQLLFWPGAKAHGTSPRMRGKRPSKIFFRFRYRNIPAYAGKTGALRIVVKRWKEHPRVCGENNRLNTNAVNAPGTSPRMRGKPPDLLKSTLLSGTSPRMRGKRTLTNNYMLCVRNIPAYAGKTTNRSSVRGCAAEHPRVCGENGRRFKPSSPLAGTSPRMRGKLFRMLLSKTCSRNIPAYAGKT